MLSQERYRITFLHDRVTYRVLLALSTNIVDYDSPDSHPICGVLICKFYHF